MRALRTVFANEPLMSFARIPLMPMRSIVPDDIVLHKLCSCAKASASNSPFPHFKSRVIYHSKVHEGGKSVGPCALSHLKHTGEAFADSARSACSRLITLWLADVLQVCQNTTSDKVSKEPVWIRATMIDSFFPTPSSYNATLGVLYFTGGTVQCCSRHVEQSRAVLHTCSSSLLPGHPYAPNTYCALHLEYLQMILLSS